MIQTVRICPHCGEWLPPTAMCSGEALPKEKLAAYALEEIEWSADDGKGRSRIPKACADFYRGADGRVRLPVAAT